jgi:CO/xanthine dehydrogenase FAD-binding subunit
MDTPSSEVVDHILDQIDPEADIHATAQYRRNLVEVLLLRALGEIR